MRSSPLRVHDLVPNGDSGTASWGLGRGWSGTFSPRVAVAGGAWAVLLSWRAVLPTRARAGRFGGGFARRGRRRAAAGAGRRPRAWDVAASQPPSRPRHVCPTDARGKTASQPPQHPTRVWPTDARAEMTSQLSYLPAREPPRRSQQWPPGGGQHLRATSRTFRRSPHADRREPEQKLHRQAPAQRAPLRQSEREERPTPQPAPQQPHARRPGERPEPAGCRARCE